MGYNISIPIQQGIKSLMIIVPQSKAKVNEKGGKIMKVIKRIPCRKKPAPDAAEQAKADACNANVVCIPIDMKRMLRNAQLSKGI